MADVRDTGHEAAGQYLGWLHRTGSPATYLLADQTAPLRFTDAEIGQLMDAMPLAPSVDETLEELSSGLRRDDKGLIKEAVGRLKHYLAGQPGPADREAYRQFIIRHGLLEDSPSLHASIKAGLYRVLLGLAFDMPLTYASYCEIEDAIGGPPRGVLRRVMSKFEFGSLIPVILLFKADPDYEDKALMAALDQQDVPPAAPLDEFAREFSNVRPGHRATVYSFAVRYLREYAENPSSELRKRGYLADMLAVVFPGDVFAQQSRLEETLGLVYGGPLGRGKIPDMFDHLNVPPSAALEAAVTRLAAWPKAEQYVREQAALARRRYSTHGNELV